MCDFCNKIGEHLHVLTTFYVLRLFRILNALGQDFQNLAEMCLLVLHLEIRCHCFYFLLQALKQVFFCKRQEQFYSDSGPE